MSPLLKRLLILALTATTIVACSATKMPCGSNKEQASAPEAKIDASDTVATTDNMDNQITPVVAASNHNATYFAFDKYNIEDEYQQGIIKANGNYLAANPDAMVQVQGNTDAIGSVEYNLALGQRRANAVKKALIAQGANNSQIEAISNGKLKAKYSNDTAEDRAKNRRSDIMYKTNEPKGYSNNDDMPMVDDSFFNGSVTEGIVK